MSWTTDDIPDQTGRVAVVTGANSGLGYESSLELARAGATVVMGVRNVEKGQRAVDRIKAQVPTAEVELRELDLGSLDSVRAFAQMVTSEHPAIDILLNNAGLMATPAGETVDGFETQVGTNHLGHFVLTEALLPALEAAPAARIVTLTSGARAQGTTLTEDRLRLGDEYDAWRAYGDSKLANYQFAIELARRLEAIGSTVSSLAAHPGYSNTNLQHATFENAGGGFQGRFFHYLVPYVGQPQDRGALPQLRAATDPDARNGEFYGPRWVIRGEAVRLDPDTKRSAPEDNARMWTLSEAQTDTMYRLGHSN
jgi:NAD(P)-dependent dehydrogenase (short-subunit alcohol dehydrogenase family)